MFREKEKKKTSVDHESKNKSGDKKFPTLISILMQIRDSVFVYGLTPFILTTLLQIERKTCDDDDDAPLCVWKTIFQ